MKEQSYDQLLEWMYEQLPMYQRVGNSAYKPNLDNTLLLMEHLGNPEKGIPTAHIAGTNGKGSTSHLIASVLAQAGYKTGLYTSPHLVDFRERILVDGQMIPREYVSGFLTRNKEFFEHSCMSFFEMSMGLAFEYFKSEGVDIAVIETGLGGRLDSTNIITPEVSIITNIGLDHVAILGDTLEKIAFEKAGIIKTGVPAVIGQAEGSVLEVFRNKAAEVQTSLTLSSPCPAHYLEICPLKGFYQRHNLSTTLTALKVLRQGKKWHISECQIEEGIRNVLDNTHLQGRWQILSQKPLVVCDTGHNAHGLKEISEQLRSLPYQKIHLVFGMVNDKDTNSVLPLLPKDARYYFCRASVARALPSEELAARAEKFGLHGDFFPDCPSAVQAARAACTPNDCVFIGGSTFVVADVLEANLFK